MNSPLVSFRMKLIMVMLLAIGIPILTTGYFMIEKAENALLKEKEEKLYSIARQLDQMLSGTYDDYLGTNRYKMVREEKIKHLNMRLGPLTDLIAEENPGVGVGYYSKELNAVITYGPSMELKDKIGLSIDETHPGKQVLEKGIPMVFTGKQVRGDIMNAMVPLIRGGEVIGYVWANELTSDVAAQMRKMEHNILLILVVGMSIGMFIALQIANALGGSIDKIIRSIDEIGNDLSYRLPSIKGVLGKIPIAVNEQMNRLVETKTHTEVIVSSVSDGIITLNNEGLVTEWNQAATSITSYTRDEMIGKPYLSIFDEKFAGHSLLLNTWQTGETHHSMDTQFPAKNGEKIPINASTALLKKQGGQTVGVAVVFRDLREKRRMEEQIRRADHLRALGELAAGMAHEIRNPLTSIKAFTQITEESMQDDDPNREYMGIIVKEVERINGLVEQLLLFGRPSIQKENQVSVPELIKQSILLLEHDLRKKELKVIKQLEDISMFADCNLIQQIIINLLLNAIQAVDHGGTLEIKTFTAADRIGMSYFNTGSHIEDHHKDTVFNPFFTSKEKGMGLGLSVTQNIVNLYKGTIFFENINHGVKFQVEFPREEIVYGEDSCGG